MSGGSLRGLVSEVELGNKEICIQSFSLLLGSSLSKD